MGASAYAKSVDPGSPAGELLVQLRSAANVQTLLARYSLRVLDQFGSRPIYRLQVMDSMEIDAVIDALALEPSVLSAEPNFLHESPEATRNNAWAVGEASAYLEQWAPGALLLEQAHLHSVGEGVRIAVLDTGVDFRHDSLESHLDMNLGFDFVDFDDNPSEEGGVTDVSFGHGTHVAGIVALVAPLAKIIPVRVLDREGRGNAWVLAEAMLYAVNPDGDNYTDDGAHVINVSLGSPGRTEIIDTIIKLSACAIVDLAADPEKDISDPGYDADRARCSHSQGAVVVAAAGNDASRRRFFPAGEGAYGLISVGASAPTGSLASFSNHGSWVDIVAPGVGITSTVPNQAFGVWSGTSMAAPMVAATAALVRALNPGHSARDVARQVVRAAAPLCSDKLDELDAFAAVMGARSREPRCL